MCTHESDGVRASIGSEVGVNSTVFSLVFTFLQCGQTKLNFTRQVFDWMLPPSESLVLRKAGGPYFLAHANSCIHAHCLNPEPGFAREEVLATRCRPHKAPKGGPIMTMQCMGHS